MRQNQQAKQAAYAAAMTKLAQPHADRFVRRLEGSLQRADEGTRPTTKIVERFFLDQQAQRDAGIDVLDIAAVLNALKATVNAAFTTGPRNFTLVYVDSVDSLNIPVGFEATLTW